MLLCYIGAEAVELEFQVADVKHPILSLMGLLPMLASVSLKPNDMKCTMKSGKHVALMKKANLL